MVEKVRAHTDTYRSWRESVSRFGRRTIIPAIISASAALTAPDILDAYNKDPQQVHMDICDFAGVPTERAVQQPIGMIHNEHIGVDPSTYLPGLLELKYHNTENDTWSLYNVVVPNVVANGSDVNAEMYGATVEASVTNVTNGDTLFTLQYEPMDEWRCVDGILETGNGAHFQVHGVIPFDRPEVHMSIVPNDDSSTIESASLGNFFGAIKNVDRLTLEDGKTIYAEDYPQPSDGNFQLGDFYSVPVPPASHIVYGNDDTDMQQWQRFTHADTLEIEVRSRHWRPEFGDDALDNWIEMQRVWQSFDEVDASGNQIYPVWSFGYTRDQVQRNKASV